MSLSIPASNRHAQYAELAALLSAAQLLPDDLLSSSVDRFGSTVFKKVATTFPCSYRVPRRRSGVATHRQGLV